MVTNIPVREAPIPQGLPTKQAPEQKEPPLAVEEIQGNILAGFNKDNQTLLFLKIDDPSLFKPWLKHLVPFIATTEEVLKFNRLFKQIRRRQCIESRTVLATWVNIAFSFQGLKKLVPDADSFSDDAFKQGLARRSKLLSDPQEGEGFQKNWLIGGEGNEPDLVLIVASDSPKELEDQVVLLETAIYDGFRSKGLVTRSGATVIFKQHGATLPDPLRGHEHFGFLDGVSQPGIKGTVGNSTELLTPQQNPADRGQGKPGQDRLWPGEFVFGYPAQDATDTGKAGKVRKAGPSWTDNGSFLVFRRLRQDVGGFHEFLKEGGKLTHLSSELFGAKCVGRWASGAPIERATLADNAKMSRDDCANNAFDFQKDTNPAPPQNPGDCQDNFLQNLAKIDATGSVCPFSGHIRKAYPRDDVTKNQQFPNEADTETRRLLRRGIPFGDPFDPTIFPDDRERGLLFLAYQTSIVNQFEFVITNWVNNPNFKEKDSGHDPVLGQTNSNGSRERFFSVPVNGKPPIRVSLKKDWVMPTGGGYFFAPSISALKNF